MEARNHPKLEEEVRFLYWIFYKEKTMKTMTEQEYERLVLRIQYTQEEAEHHRQKRQEMGKCCALLIKKAIEDRGLTLADNQFAVMCGTQQAALMSYLRMAYGSDYQLDSPLMEHCEDILVGLGELETTR